MHPKKNERPKLLLNLFHLPAKNNLVKIVDHWMNTPTDCLALVILLNQFTRNVYRNTADMFKG